MVYWIFLYGVAGLIMNWASNKIQKRKGWSWEAFLLWPLMLFLLVLCSIFSLIDMALEKLDRNKK